MRLDDRHPLVLLIEEDPLLGLDVGEALAEAGYRVAGPLRNHDEALAWVARRRPDLAVVDGPVLSRDGGRLARALTARGVPFLVHAAIPVDVSLPAPPDAGRGRDAAACAALRAAPRLTKPAWPGDLVHVLGQLLPGQFSREARP
ncbi:hypothetical protein DK419_18740 [Methylobacterium terrae]|uniref:Response regulatory domain-containing protein n=1 Tax=Methylobacterium terrae TaxID=2202827 RepID=A0A2U8WRI3_9HYPH|nr:response regulator [Methylobacterium terrae]AWN48118.1 hypothetical protein DK419_18740 [Methylobacterium terrae]